MIDPVEFFLVARIVLLVVSRVVGIRVVWIVTVLEPAFVFAVIFFEDNYTTRATGAAYCDKCEQRENQD